MKLKKRMILYIPLTVLVILFTWGMVEPYTIDVEEEEAVIPNLPEEWEDRKIIAIGDFQVGMWLDNDGLIEDVVDRIIDRSPDAVVLLGDYVYQSVNDHQNEMEKVQSYLKPLTEEGIPVYAVLGNHDYNMSSRKVDPSEETAERVRRKLKDIDIEILHNRSVALENERADEPLYLTGIGARWPEKDEIPRAFENIEEEDARFVMMHNPESFDEIPEGAASTAVAGHTHGGQIRIPFTPHWSWKDLVAKGKARVDGWTKEEYGNDENSLYVNRGIGLSMIPVRVNNPPEITEFQLTGAEE
ncbi:metallophosphoesterase [Halobacillus sp. SY10]|uniref:metallophosphoesterase n=1 Tax=Halobacillus sp. SY10 TaxID=3381356 RepID=UPI003879924C